MPKIREKEKVIQIEKIIKEKKKFPEISNAHLDKLYHNLKEVQKVNILQVDKIEKNIKVFKEAMDLSLKDKKIDKEIYNEFKNILKSTEKMVKKQNQISKRIENLYTKFDESQQEVVKKFQVSTDKFTDRFKQFYEENKQIREGQKFKKTRSAFTAFSSAYKEGLGVSRFVKMEKKDLALLTGSKLLTTALHAGGIAMEQPLLNILASKINKWTKENISRKYEIKNREAGEQAQERFGIVKEQFKKKVETKRTELKTKLNKGEITEEQYQRRLSAFVTKLEKEYSSKPIAKFLKEQEKIEKEKKKKNKTDKKEEKLLSKLVKNTELQVKAMIKRDKIDAKRFEWQKEQEKNKELKFKASKIQSAKTKVSEGISKLKSKFHLPHKGSLLGDIFDKAIDVGENVLGFSILGRMFGRGKTEKAGASLLGRVFGKGKNLISKFGGKLLGREAESVAVKGVESTALRAGGRFALTEGLGALAGGALDILSGPVGWGLTAAAIGIPLLLKTKIGKKIKNGVVHLFHNIGNALKPKNLLSTLGKVLEYGTPMGWAYKGISKFIHSKLFHKMSHVVSHLWSGIKNAFSPKHIKSTLGKILKYGTPIGLAYTGFKDLINSKLGKKVGSEVKHIYSSTKKFIENKVTSVKHIWDDIFHHKKQNTVFGVKAKEIAPIQPTINKANINKEKTKEIKESKIKEVKEQIKHHYHESKTIQMIKEEKTKEIKPVTKEEIPIQQTMPMSVNKPVVGGGEYTNITTGDENSIPSILFKHFYFIGG